MAQAPSILNADRGRVTLTALGFLCLLALIQVALVARSVWQKAENGVPQGKTVGLGSLKSFEIPAPTVLPTVSFSPPPVGQLAPSAPAPTAVPAPAQSFSPPPVGSFAPPSAVIPTVVPAISSVMPPPSVPQPSATAPPQVGQTTPVPPVSPASVVAAPKPPADSVSSMSLEEIIELAKQVRGLGDMQGALEVLKRADLQYPARPETLAEMAQCYETMGLNDKASAIWRQLESMDPARAAGFRDLAKRRLNAPVTTASASSSGGASFMEAGKTLSLGACQAVRDTGSANGEKVVLRVPILRQGNTAVDPSQVDIDVYFFDRVNGEKIAQTIADEPVSSWAAAPVDWSGIGEEPLDVTYFLPTLTPGEIAAHGRRSYHGYVVRLYYQHKLQDVAAEPRDLLDFGSRAPQTVPGGVNPLLPPVTN